MLVEAALNTSYKSLSYEKVKAKEMFSITQLFFCVLSQTSFGALQSVRLPVHGSDDHAEMPKLRKGHSSQPLVACKNH